jgi:hypothetical protein
MNHRQEIDGQLLEPGRDAAALFEPAIALLDRAALTVGLAIEPYSAIVRVLVDAPRDDGPDRVASQPPANPLGAVALVSGHRCGTLTTTDAHSIHDRFELRAVVDLPRRDVGGEGNSVTFSNQVDFAPESAARAAQSVVVGLARAPLFPAPAAAFEARTELPSTHHRSQSMWPSASSRICSASSTRSNAPWRRQVLKCE